MKYTYIIALLMLIACSKPSREEVAIKNYASSMGKNTMLDIDFKLIDQLKELGEIKATDSLTYFRGQYKKGNLRAFADTLKVRLDERNKIITDVGSKGMTRDHTRKYIEKMKQDVVDIQSALSLLDKYLTDSTRVLYKRIQCHYKAKNPFLNNVEQEITRVYHYDTTRDLVVGSEE